MTDFYKKVGESIDGIQVVVSEIKDRVLNKYLYGCVSKESVLLIPCAYTELVVINSSIIIANRGDALYGIIDKNENVVLPFNYERIELTQEGLLFLSDSHQYDLDIDYMCLMDINLQIHLFYDNNEIILPSIYRHAGAFYKGFCKVERNGFWGVINHELAEVIPCMYQEIIRMNDRLFLCRLKKSSYKNAIFHDVVFNVTDNSIICVPQGCHIKEYLGQANAFIVESIFIKSQQGPLYGLMDGNGEILVSCNYHEINLCCGCFILRQDNKWGIADIEGHIVVPCAYEGIYRNVNDINISHPNILILCNKLGDNIYQYGLVDDRGKIIVPCEYSSIKEFDKNRFITNDNAIYDIDGRIIIQASEKLNSIKITEKGNYKISLYKNGHLKYGLVSREGVEIIPCDYTYIHDFKDGFAKFIVGGYLYYDDCEYLRDETNYTLVGDARMGIIDEQGSIIVKPEYLNIKYVKDGIMVAQNQHASWTIYNVEQNTIIFDNLNLQVINSMSERIVTYQNITAGFIKVDSAEIIETSYETIGMFSCGLALVSMRDSNGIVKKGYINTNNNLIIPLEYKYATTFNNDTARVHNDKGEYLIDTTGKIVKVYREYRRLCNSAADDVFYSDDDLRDMYREALGGNPANEWNVD